MFNAMRAAFKKPVHTREDDPLTAATSLAAQENQAAAERLKSVMCKFIGGDNGEGPCALKLVHKQ